MATARNIEKAKALIAIGAWVFPAYVKKDPENPYQTTKKPATPNGFLDATNDPFYVEDLFEKHPNAEVAVWMGASGLMSVDIDVKRDPEGKVLVDGFDNFEDQWLDLPDTYAFDSVSKAGGRQFIYIPPKDKSLGPSSNYRGIQGVDIRAGGSWSVWPSDAPVPESRTAFAHAPEWALDEKTAKTAEKFTGTVKDWYETLETGEPSLIVRKAIERVENKFKALGNDFSHGDIVEVQYEAVRLGAEGHPGVPVLLDKIEELFYAREGSHSRGEDEWAHEFQEALASGIEKAGEAIALRKALPAYSLALVPNSVPDYLIAGAPGDKDTFRDLLREMLKGTNDDLVVTSVLWNSPRTKDLSREWGLEFVHKRVQEARVAPEPVKENPALEERKNAQEAERTEFLTAKEVAVVESNPTFIDRYLEASATKGFMNPTYAVPAAWTCLSMAFGRKGIIPLSKDIGVNLWFLVLGYSTTGKSTEDAFHHAVMDLFLKESDGEYYNVGATSTPQGVHETLLLRDGKPSIVHHDEASDFFLALRNNDWMGSVTDSQARWYEGYVPPEQKVRLKELRGKDARTSFNIHMMGTPDRLLGLLDMGMFESGYLARVNWVWGDRSADPDAKYRIRLNANRKSSETPVEQLDLGLDLLLARMAWEKTAVMSASDKVMARINKAHRDFDKKAKKHKRYDKIYAAVDRLGMETLWKCSLLLAMYEGRQEVWMEDVLTAISHAEVWFDTMLRVASEISESPYSRDVDEMESYIRDEGGSVTRAALLHHFKGKIVRSQRELDDRINFMLESGRIVRDTESTTITYMLNGQ